MFSTTITLNPSAGITGSTNVSLAFDVTSLEKEGSRRAVAGNAPGLPHLLEIQHQEAGKEGSKVDRHLTRVSKSAQAESTDPVTVCSAHVVITVPRTGWTVSAVQDVVGTLVDFLNDSANITKLLNGEP